MSNSFFLKKCEKKDLDRVAQLERELFDSPYSISSLTEELSNPSSFFVSVFTNTNILAAYLIVRFIADECEILKIAVDNSIQRSGAGRKLIEHLLEKCREGHTSNIFLEVSIENEKAINFYCTMGFERVGLRKNYYHSSDALIMKKRIH